MYAKQTWAQLHSNRLLLHLNLSNYTYYYYQKIIVINYFYNYFYISI